MSEQSDQSTSKVIEWLRHYNVKFIRINKEQNPDDLIGLFIVNRDMKIKTITIGNIYNNIKIKWIWFRRGSFSTDLTPNFNLEKVRSDIFIKIERHLSLEINDFFESVYLSLKLNIVNNPIKYKVNKILALQVAVSVGLFIPKTIITNSKKATLKYFHQTDTIICKPISDILTIYGDNFITSHSIKVFDIDFISKLPEKFHYSLFQKYIEKKFEIRAFYFVGEIYAIANFSQNNKLSQIDGRNLVDESGKSNRLVDFHLPNSLQTKIVNLMKKLNLESGSIDLIYGRDSKFYFLEVNPVGQFDYLSYWGNFYIERKIAKILSHEYKI